jgi:hypothetical protein
MSGVARLFVLFTTVFCFEASFGQDTQSDAEASSSESEAVADSAAEEAAVAQSSAGGVKTLSGMSILGNEEAPKSLVIVPWKSSELGDGISVNDLVDERARPVDKEVFLRELRYYELRSGAAE